MTFTDGSNVPEFGKIRPVIHHLLAHDDLLVRVMQVVADVQRFAEDEHQFIG